jgi:hypothetical protein
VQAGTTLALCGLIWFVQLVHDLLFALLGRCRFGDYEREHARLTGWVVGPLMIGEKVSALLLLIWLSTAGLQVPKHRRLTTGSRPGPGE